MQSSLTRTQLPQSHHNSWQRAEPEQSVLYRLISRPVRLSQACSPNRSHDRTGVL